MPGRVLGSAVCLVQVVRRLAFENNIGVEIEIPNGVRNPTTGGWQGNFDTLVGTPAPHNRNLPYLESVAAHTHAANACFGTNTATYPDDMTVLSHRSVPCNGTQSGQPLLGRSSAFVGWCTFVSTS